MTISTPTSTSTLKLNCGNLWTTPFLNRVIELNKESAHVKVASLFGSIPYLTPTARSFDRLPCIPASEAVTLIDKAESAGISIRYTLNQSCIGDMQTFREFWNSQLKLSLQCLHNYGIHEWTVTSPLLVTLLRDLFPDDYIEVSTIYETSTPQEALHMKWMGANAVNISTSINRKASAITNIIKTGVEVTLLANEACLYRCPLRRECYNLSSHNSVRGDAYFNNYPFGYCNTYRIDHPVEWVKSRMILPSWMKLYQRDLGIDRFKVSCRTHPYETAIPIIEYYMRQQDPPSLLDLWPTIAHLGNTAEPKDIHFIKTSNFTPALYKNLLDAGEECDSQICGTTCRICYRVTEYMFEHNG